MSSKTGYQVTISKVLAKASKEMIDELDDAYSQAIKILEEYELESIADAEKIVKDKDRDAEIFHRQIVGDSSNKARSSYMKLMDEHTDKVFTTALERLSSIKHGNSLLKVLISECIDALEGVPMTLYCNKSDFVLVKKISSEFSKTKKLKIKVSSKYIDTAGGIRAIVEDGFIRFDNTFESRIERLKPELRRRISILFSRSK